MNSSLRLVQPHEFQNCLSFLSKRESYCISLCSYLFANGEPSFPTSSLGNLFMLTKTQPLGEEITGVLFITASGILFHCFSDDIHLNEYDKELSATLIASRVRCILGRKTEGVFLESLSAKKNRFTVDYQLLTFAYAEQAANTERTIDLPDQSFFSKLHLREVDKNCAQSLLELQEGYEKEEVIPPGDLFSREVCLENIRKTLLTQTVFALYDEDKAIAKVGTNAKGKVWDQIGGVYTLPAFRGKGCASLLMEHICKNLHFKKRNIALFVKNSNTCAQKIYCKIGFTYETDFRIAYF